MSFADVLGSGRFPGCELSVISEGSYRTSQASSLPSSRNNTFDEGDSIGHGSGHGSIHPELPMTPSKMLLCDSSLLLRNAATSSDDDEDDHDLSSPMRRMMLEGVDMSNNGTVTKEAAGESGVFRNFEETDRPVGKSTTRIVGIQPNTRKFQKKSSQRQMAYHAQQQQQQAHFYHGREEPIIDVDHDNGYDGHDYDHASPLEEIPVTQPLGDQATASYEDEYPSNWMDPNPKSHHHHGGWGSFCCPSWMQHTPCWFKVAIVACVLMVVACLAIGLVAARLQQQQNNSNSSTSSHVGDQDEFHQPAPLPTPTPAPSLRPPTAMPVITLP